MNRPAVSVWLLLGLFAILAIALVARHNDHQISRAAQALIAGKARGAADAAREPDDPNLSSDEEAAGALWARRHPGRRCLTDPPAFARGCRQVEGN
jgi:hypothetical protein